MFDLQKFLEKHAEIQTKLGDEWIVRCDCDRSKGSKHWHLWVNLRKQMGICYRCGLKLHDVISVVAAILHCAKSAAQGIVAEGETGATKLADILDNLDPQAYQDAQETPIKIVLPREMKRVTHTSKVPKYATSRGLTRAICLRHNIGWCDSGYYKNRLIVPIYDLKGSLVSFVARWMGKPSDDIKKVLYPKGSKTSQYLFNHKIAATKKTIVITEGVFDAIAVGSCAVALFGKHASKTQLGLLAELGQTRKLVVMLDTDAQNEARDLAEDLTVVSRDVRLARLASGIKDPGDAPRREICRSIRLAEKPRQLSDITDLFGNL